MHNSLLLSARRPSITKHNALPPFDQSDSGGQVHTIPPPELKSLDIRADFNGVCIDLNRWNLKIDFNNNWLIGANSTPFNMLMTPMLPMYSRKIQDAVLTEHAERGYTHFVVASSGWNFDENGFGWSPFQFATWCQYVKSWGFKIVYWAPAILNDSYMNLFVDRMIVGEEVDSKMTAEQYETVLDNVLDNTGGEIPLGAHFTANYPEGFPRDTFLTNWSKYDGKVHLMWQANQNESAGTQAARLYYARQRVNLGTIGGDGIPALNSKVYAFETMASAQLLGKCTEEYGCLRSLELLYATRTDDRIQPMAGFGNGCRLPDGSAI